MLVIGESRLHPLPNDGNVLAGVDKKNTSLVRSRRKPN